MKWGDYLIIGSSSYSENVQLFAINLVTGEHDLIYDEIERGDFANGNNFRRYVSHMQIIDDTLYFSVGGYLAAGATYWIDLPPQGEVYSIDTKMVTEIASSVVGCVDGEEMIGIDSNDRIMKS